VYITRKSLSRRTVLRGLGGVAVSLPFLDAMVPALAAATEEKVARQLRFAAVYMPNGVLPDAWHPKELGTEFTFTSPMKSLEPFRSQLVTIKGLSASGIPSPHLGASSGWLNGVGSLGLHGQHIRSGKTFDQYAAEKLSQGAALESLQLGTEDTGTAAGSCDGYDCVYFDTLSWKTDTTPLPAQINPRLLFETMYGATGTKEQRLAALNYRRSILDAIGDETRRLLGDVGAADKRRVSDYLDNVREAERRVQNLMQRAETSNAELPSVPMGIPSAFPEHVELNYSLMHLALQGDITRVITFMTALEASNQGYDWIGVADTHHVVSHHGGIPELQEKYMKIVTWKVEQFARFVQMMRDTPDGDGSLLDHSLLYFGTGMGNGNPHTRNDPASVLVGGVNGRLKGGRSLQARAGALHSDLLLNLGELLEVELTKIGPSKGRLENM
jgi:hypothetical protein